MLARQHRFHGYNSLAYVYKNGVSARGPLFAIKTAPNSRRQTYRAAVVVSKKVHKSAVVRNRIRRRLYAALGELTVGIKQPQDIIITVFNDTILTESAAQLQHQLKKQLTQAGVLV